MDSKKKKRFGRHCPRETNSTRPVQTRLVGQYLIQCPIGITLRPDGAKRSSFPLRVPPARGCLKLSRNMYGYRSGVIYDQTALPFPLSDALKGALVDGPATSSMSL